MTSNAKRIIPGAYALLAGALLAALLAVGCQAEEPPAPQEPPAPEERPEPTATLPRLEVPRSVHDREMAAGHAAAAREEAQEALAHYLKARESLDSPEARDAISRTYGLMAEQEEDAARKVALLEKAVEARSTPELERKLSDARRALRAQLRRQYEEARRTGTQAAERGDWAAAVAAYERAAALAPEAGVDADEARQALDEASDRLRAYRPFQEALKAAQDALEAGRYAEAAQGYAKAAELAEGLELPQERLAELQSAKQDAEARRRYAEADAAWREAADAGDWEKTVALLKEVQRLGEGLQPRPEGYAQLPEHLARAEAEIRRAQGLGLLETAKKALGADRMDEARQAIGQARELMGEAEEVAQAVARVEARERQLRPYAEAKAALERAGDDLAQALPAALAALAAGRAIEPPPADFAETEARAAAVRRLAMERRRELMAAGGQAERAGELEAAIRHYQAAAQVSEDPRPAEMSVARAQEAMEERARREAEAARRREAYRALLREAEAAEEAGQPETALDILARARELAEDPGETDRLAEAVRQRVAMREEYPGAVESARQLDQERAAFDERLRAWTKAVEMGRQLRPAPDDLARHERVLLDLRLQDRERRTVRAAEEVAKGTAAEQRGDLRAALEHYSRAAALSEDPAEARAKAKAVGARLKFLDALEAAQGTEADAPLPERLAAWRAAFESGAALEPKPEGFQEAEEAYRAIAATAMERRRALREQAVRAAERGEHDAALAALHEAAPLADDPEAAKREIARFRESIEQEAATRRERAEREARRAEYRRLTAEAEALYAQDRLEEAIAALASAQPLAEDEAEIARKLQAAQARAAALAPYREASAAAEAAFAEGEVVAGLDALARAVEAGGALDPPPHDLEAQRSRLARLEKERAERFGRLLEQAAEREEAGRLEDALARLRGARRLLVGDPGELDARIANVEGRVRMAEAERRRAEHDRLVEEARTALAEDRAADAAQMLSKAKELAEDPAALEELIARARERAEQLQPYEAAVEQGNERLRQRLLREALEAYREAYEIGLDIEPRPADFAATEATIEAVDEARREYASELAEDAEAAWRKGLLRDALAGYRKAASQDEGNEDYAEAVARLEAEIARRDADPGYRELRRFEFAALRRALEQGDGFMERGLWRSAAMAYNSALTVALEMRPRPDNLAEIREKLDSARRSLDPPLERRNPLGMTLRLVRPGTYARGSDGRREREGPAHQVTITRPFYLATTPVTNEQYAHFLEATGRPAPAGVPAWEGGRLQEGYADHPVTGVSYDDALAFCRWLSGVDGIAYRLPTEGEWEYACRAGTQTDYYWGNDASPSFANFVLSGKEGTTPARRYPANPWGFYDMLGNVAEWCADWFGRYAAAPRTDPTGPDSGERRVVRGGWYRGVASEITVFARVGAPPGEASPWIGFRVAADQPPERGTMD